MAKRTHGGNTAIFIENYGREPLDFSASINPFGMPPAVREAAIRAVDISTAYPDSRSRRLRTALGNHFVLPTDWIWCGNGAAEILYRLALTLRPATALVPAPTFIEYEAALETVQCNIIHHTLAAESGFHIDYGFVERIDKGIDLVVVCQPNNPTGHFMEPELVDALVERCRSVGATLLVDESFCGLSEQKERYSTRRLLPRNPHLHILGSFTKLYGMAGLRLGFLLSSNSEIIQSLEEVGPPWSVSTVAQEAGLVALRQTEFAEQSRTSLARERQFLAEELKARGIQVIGVGPNYIFFRSDNLRLAEELTRQSILIRDCSSFRGLQKGYYRIAVRLPEENATLLTALDMILNGENHG